MVALPGVQRGFGNGVGTFISGHDDNGTNVLHRGVWDEITGNSHRWRQGVSRDGGKTWKDTWVMKWRRS